MVAGGAGAGGAVSQASPDPLSSPGPLLAPLSMVGNTGGMSARQALLLTEMRVSLGQSLLPWEPPGPTGT